MGLGVTVISGCGPQVAENSSDEGNADTASESGAQATEPSASGAMSQTDGTSADTAPNDTSPDDTSPGDTSADDACADFDNDDPPPPVTFPIEIRNVGAQPLLLNQPCEAREFVRVSNDEDWTWPGDFCAATCQAQFTEGCWVCGPCFEAYYIVVAPGASLEVDWGGVLFERATPPQACFESGSCGDSCQRARTYAGDALSVAVTAITEADCLAGEPDPELSCGCEPGPEGWCMTQGQAFIEPTIDVVTQFDRGPGQALLVELSG